MLIFIFPAGQLKAQLSVYQDKYWSAKVDSTLNLIYNLEFEKAEVQIKLIEAHYGEHPAVLLLKAEKVFWKYRPLKKGTEPYEEYMSILNKVIERTEDLFPEDTLEMESNF